MYYTLTIGVRIDQNDEPTTLTPIEIRTSTGPFHVEINELETVKNAFGDRTLPTLQAIMRQLAPRINDREGEPHALTLPEVELPKIHENPIPVHFVGKGRINVGATIFQDHNIFSWPCCKPPASEYPNRSAKDPKMLFDVEWKNGRWTCKAPGYGLRGNYGSGAIFLKNFDGVTVVEQSEQNDD